MATVTRRSSAKAPGVSKYDAATETWEPRPSGYAYVEFRSPVKEPKKPAESVMQAGDELVEPKE